MPAARHRLRHDKVREIDPRATNSQAHAMSNNGSIHRPTIAMIRRPFQCVLCRMRRRRWVIALLVPVLLFAQLATAAYLCPQISQAIAMAAPMPADCDASTADPDQPALCKAHCVADAQASGSPLDLTPALFVFDSHAASPMPFRTLAAVRVVTRYTVRASGPPLYLLHMVLRN
jgi:hypothetical protein